MTTETIANVTTKIKDRSWLEQPFAFTEADIKKHCPRLAKEKDEPREARVRVVKHVWAKSTYKAEERFVERCSCGHKRRGENHDNGDHHSGKYKKR